jgi:hypothetical protein
LYLVPLIKGSVNEDFNINIEEIITFNISTNDKDIHFIKLED